MEKSQGRGNAKWWVLVSLLLVCCLVQAAAAGETHQVGGPPGWSIPSVSNVNYTVWASTQTFSVGDTLYFNYSSSLHNVLEVTEAAYDGCNTSSPIMKWDDGNTTIELNQTGTTYYICGITGHCSLGQKVAVTVETAANSTAPAASSSASSAAPRALSRSAGALLSPLFALSLISIVL